MAAAAVAVVGGGPAGLMAAEVLARGGLQVDLYDAMPSVGRKFLLAGRGGLNLTHSEPLDTLLTRYPERRAELEPALREFGPADVRAWASGLGIETFVGSSGRVFPLAMKAAPLLRTWLQRLRASGVRLHMRHRWIGWGAAGASAAALRFATPHGVVDIDTRAVVLALGGASWSRLGSDAAWVPLLIEKEVEIARLRPSNCGFDVERPWSEHFRSRFAGHPLKTVALSVAGACGGEFAHRGEFIVTDTGVEGSLIYAASAPLLRQIEAVGSALVHVDLLPARGASFVRDELARPRGSRSLSTHLKTRLGISGVKAGLLRELLPPGVFGAVADLAQAIKALPLTLAAPRPVDEAISTSGGVAFAALDRGLMLRQLPGVFCAGEMLDWDAPTGGYLLTACLATGAWAAHAALADLNR